MLYILTVKRGGFEDRKKPYTYEKSALDAFDRAIVLHSRLAAEITLASVDEDDQGTQHYTNVRAWDRVNGITIPAPLSALEVSTEPVVLYDFTYDGLDREEVQQVGQLFPGMLGYDDDPTLLNIIYVTELVTHPDDTIGTSLDVANNLLDASGVKDEKRPYAIVLPNDMEQGGEISAILVQLIKQHTGRHPVVLAGHSPLTYTNEWVLVDLNNSL